MFQMPIVNAPFRFYYAYNYLRLNQTIVPPDGRLLNFSRQCDKL